tara:strand:- start:204 stop:1193 length:990 start_codon:yes stop_codon:yes gene_type:complete
VKPKPDLPNSITIEFDDNHVLPLLYGHHNSNLAHIEKTLDVRLDSFGNIIQISGTKDNAIMAKTALEAIYKRISNTKGQSEEAPKGMIDDALRWAKSQSPDAISRFAENSSAIATWKKTISAKSKMQQDYLDAITKNDVVFGIGPAGTGKTYLAVARAVDALKSGQVERIILSRPAVEAGERLGFLPGDMKEKVDPYLRPLYDAIYDMMPPDKMDRMMAAGQIEIAPLAFMRGRTLAQSFVIIDEAQNTTAVQMKMVLTRIGDDSKMVITGDLGQIDLPSGQTSGLADAVSLLDGVKGIDITTFTGEDVVRHPVVARILKAYDKRDNKT